MSAPVELPTLAVLAAPSATVTPSPERARLVRRARLLAWVGLGWHGVEAAVAIGAGIVAGSVALIGFGADSLIELLAGFVVLWRFATRSPIAERRAQQLIAVSFYAIGAYVAVEAVRSLVGGDEPAVSWVGIGLSIFTLATMPAIAIAAVAVKEGRGAWRGDSCCTAPIVVGDAGCPDDCCA